MSAFPLNSAARQGLLSLGFALALCLVALTGADHPPPPGFALLVLACMVWCGLVAALRWRLRAHGRVTQLSWVAGSAAAISMVMWVALLTRSVLVDEAVLEPDLAIGAAVITVLGSLGGAMFVVASWLLVDARN